MTQSIALDYSVPRTRPELFYGWVMMAVSAVAMVATLPGRSFGLGLITEPLMRDMALTPDQFARMNLWATLIGACFCLPCGPLIDRVGARAVLVVTYGLLGASVLAMSRVTTPSGLLVMLILTRGFGQSVLSVVSLTLIGKWFSRRLPMAMGIFALIVAIGFMAAFGGIGAATKTAHWRQIWSVMGWVLVGGLLPTAWLLARRTPESIGQTVDGSAEAGDGELPTRAVFPTSELDVQAGFTTAAALTSPAFWAYALASASYALVATPLLLFNERVLSEHGFDHDTVIVVVSIITLFGLIGNFGGGYLGKFISVGRLLAGAMFLLGLSLLLLPIAHHKATLYAYAIAFGAAGGVVTVGFFVCWGKVFGRRHLGAIQGTAQVLTVLASAAGPVLLTSWTVRMGTSSGLFYALAAAVLLLGVFCIAAPVPGQRRHP